GESPYVSVIMECIHACKTNEMPIYACLLASAVFSLANLYISLTFVNCPYQLFQGASATFRRISYRNIRSTSTRVFTVTCISSLVIVRLRSILLSTVLISARSNKFWGNTFSDVLGSLFNSGKCLVHAPVISKTADSTHILYFIFFIFITLNTYC